MWRALRNQDTSVQRSNVIVSYPERFLSRYTTIANLHLLLAKYVNLLLGIALHGSFRPGFHMWPMVCCWFTVAGTRRQSCTRR